MGPGYWKLNTSVLGNLNFKEDLKPLCDKMLLNVENIEPEIWDLFKEKCKSLAIIHSKRLNMVFRSKFKTLQKQFHNFHNLNRSFPGVYENELQECLFIWGFTSLQHCTGHITTGSWKGRGNQYIQFVRVLYCKLPTNGKQLPAFPLEAVTGIEPRPQRWEARVLPLCHRGPQVQECEDNLNQLFEEYSEGYRVRSKVNKLSFDEKPSRFFLNKECHRTKGKFINKLEVREGDFVKKKNDILFHVRSFINSCLQKNLLTKV